MPRAAAWLFVAVLAIMLTACGGQKKAQPLPAGTPVLAFGDSVTFGTGAGEGEDYPSRLATLTGWKIANAGIPGDTAREARSRIGAALDEHRPALVLVEIGGNDFLRRRAEKEVKEDVRAILAEIRTRQLPVVLVAVPRFSILGAAAGALPDATLYAELAEEMKLPLVPKVFAAVLSDPTLKSDEVHPNAAGYRRLAEGIAKGLRESGYLR